MSEIDVKDLFRKVMAMGPADRLRLAAGLLEAKRPDLRVIALDVAKSALQEIEIPIVLERLDGIRKTCEEMKRAGA